MSLIRQLRRGLSSLAHSRQADREVDDEVRNYLDESAAARRFQSAVSASSRLRPARVSE